MQSWFYRLPAAVRALVIGVLSAAAIFSVMSLYSATDPWGDTQESVIARLAVSTVAGVLTGVTGVVLGDQRIQRIYGSTDHAIRYSRALRTGELPTSIEPVVWQGWVATSRQANRWAPTAVGVFALIALLHSVDHRWTLAALFAVMATWQSLAALVLRRRIARLAAAIGQHAAEQSLGLP